MGEIEYFYYDSQKAFCRSAVYGIPVTLQGLAAVAEEPFDRVKSYAQNWQKRTLPIMIQKNPFGSFTVFLGHGFWRSFPPRNKRMLTSKQVNS